MAFPVLAVAAMAGSMLSQGAGARAASEATIEGAKSAAAIQDKNIALQRQIYDDQVRRTQPYLQFGVGGIHQLLDKYRDPRSTPEYQFRAMQGRNALASMAGYDPSVIEAAAGKMGKDLAQDEYDKMYGRAIDRVKIGQGEAATAGQSATGYGQALAGAYQTAGRQSALANMMAQRQMEQGYSNLSGQAASIPAAIYGSNRLAQMNQRYGGTPDYNAYQGYA